MRHRSDHNVSLQGSGRLSDAARIDTYAGGNSMIEMVYHGYIQQLRAALPLEKSGQRMMVTIRGGSQPFPHWNHQSSITESLLSPPKSSAVIGCI